MGREGEAAMRCLPKEVAAADAVLAAVDGAVAVVAFLQLFRIHLRNQQLGWTRQKIFHLMIGSSNIGYLAYFISALVATCKGWQCWSHGCGFVLMVGPQIIFFAAFLLLISFWVDLCHQASDDEEEDYERGYSEALLDKSMDKQGRLHVDGCRVLCFPRAIHVGSRQKFVILVIALTFISMIVFSILIWIGGGKNSIDSSIAARVYLYTFSAAMLLLGGALASYGCKFGSCQCSIFHIICCSSPFYYCTIGDAFALAFTTFRELNQFNFYFSLLFYRFISALRLCLMGHERYAASTCSLYS